MTVRERREQIPFNMAIGYMELVHECFAKHTHTQSGRTGSAAYTWRRVRAPVSAASLAIRRPRLHRAIRGTQGGG